MNNDSSYNESTINWSPNSASSSFRVQINDYDTYQTWPTKLDQLYTVVSQVPIIRIYGSLSINNDEKNNEQSPKRKKPRIESNETSVFNVVIHVHNFYPYFYVDCNETNYEKLKDKKFIDKVINYLETSLKESFKRRRARNGHEDQEVGDDDDSRRKYIANVSICKAVSIYGFQLGYRLFYKISLLSPLYKSRLTNMFHERKVSLDDIENPVEKKPITYIYEAHIPYLLQFLTDFNLFGCGWINIDHELVNGTGTRGLYFRSPIFTELHRNFHEPHKLNILSNYLTKFLNQENVLDNSFVRIGKSIVEVDITTNHNFNKDPNFNKFETAYGLVDYEKNLKFHDKKPMLLQWTDFEELFIENVSVENQFIESEDESEEERLIDVNKPEVMDEQNNDDDLDSQELDFKHNNFGSQELVANEIISLPNETKSDEKEAIISTQFDEDMIQNQSQLFDSFSFTPTAEQPIYKNMHVGKNTYDISIPEQLKLSNLNDAFQSTGTLKIDYPDPFYSDPKDLSKPFIFANQKFVIPLKNESIIPKLFSDSLHLGPDKELTGIYSTWEYSIEPPSKMETINFIKYRESKAIKRALKYRSQIEPGKTQAFKYSYNSEKVSRKPDEFNFLTSLHLEIHANPPNAELVADPLRDPISLIFYSFDDTNEMFNCKKSGVLMFGEYEPKMIQQLSESLSCHTEIFSDEIAMVAKLVQLVEIFDPDILSGYEVISMSWGYIIERFINVFGINMMSDLSRGTFKSNGKFGDRWGYTHTSNIEICGRHMINVWRVLRSELSLTSYSLENVTYHLLHRTLPKYSNHQLTQWLKANQYHELFIVMSYYMKRIELILKIIAVQELITRNVEHSRLIGIDFNSNFYRGSQYKVESILARIAKTESLLLNSPSKTDVHEMRPFESIPLILEPKANFYKSPLVVLDFQSLYPSIMIAYNYCYSTLLCKLHNYKKNKNDIGYLKSLKLNPGLVDLLKKDDAINISPNGFMFVKSHIRKSILAKMLEEILNIRIKLKNVMKLFKDDAELTKLYNARQNALKLIANVTYGYTSATYSGRMPCSDIADAIVSTGREILTKSMEMIESENYGAKVVYGDTDSLFVYFPGKSKQDAFKYGKEIAKKVTDFFPDPIHLKFEKVYHPCILLAKKRYVGYSYEYENQEVAKFDAKGIETVRRDGIPAQQKITEKCLRILFETQNLSTVKEYTIKQFYKILFNKISVQDFCFAKEVRYGNYKNERYLPPGALLASEKAKDDPRSEPQYRERIPYIVYRDSTKQRIKDRVLSPEDLIKTYTTENPLTLDSEYYITRVLIPPLERFFNLFGADVRGWYKEMPKYQRIQSLYSDSCLICGNRLDNESFVCSKCSADQQSLENDVELTFKNCQKDYLKLQNLCRTCIHNTLKTGYDCVDDCVNRDCSIYYNKVKNVNEYKQVREKRDKIIQW
ncbi:unnamed protein product [Candida verbasci]|uniref:DNA polymerase n=1 Tax=Candida verbasci TaxID=1227364 RepID=A0A9W4TWC5_9ASCO|nr:unnamed protein product [Candida verbasci]